MRKPSWVLSVLLLVGATLVSPAAKPDITYAINETLPGGGSIVGSITTNGSTGTLGYIEIDSWSFGVSDGLNTGTSNMGSGAGRIDLGDINVTPTNMVFNLGAANGGDLILPVTNSNGNSGPSYIEWVAAQCPICGEVAAVNIGGDGVTDALTGLTGSVLIGTAIPATTPEPMPFALLATGAGMAIGWLRKRRTPRA